MLIISGGVGTRSHPFRTLNASSHSIVVVPAPSTVALIPQLPMALLENPVITEAVKSLRFSDFGVNAAHVGHELICVRIFIRCCAEVALAFCPTQNLRKSRLGLGALAGVMRISVGVLITVLLLI